jgi:Replication-relaxation
MSPVGGPIASSTPASNPNRGRESAGLPPAQHLRSLDRRSPHPPITNSLHPSIPNSLELSDRDRHVLGLVARFRIVSGAQLRDLFWPEGTTETRARLARRSLARLATLDLLAPLARRVGGVRAGSAGYCFTLGPAGQRLLRAGRPRRPVTPGSRHLAHTLAVAQLYVDLVMAQRWGLGELLAFEPEPACWRRYPGPYGTSETLKPDAYLRLASDDYEDSWFVEVDLDSESQTTIAGKAERYLDCFHAGVVQKSEGIFPRTIWTTPSDKRADALRAIFARLPEDGGRLFVVTTRDEAVSHLVGGTPS